MTQAAPVTFETCAVALSLAAIARLQSAFMHTSSPRHKQALLQCAADFMDRTVPSSTLREQLGPHVTDQVGFLIDKRADIAPIPPGLWRQRRVSVTALPVEHQTGVQALERYLRHDKDSLELQCVRVLHWLTPELQKRPELAAECASLRQFL